jgi:hypothetical protein
MIRRLSGLKAQKRLSIRYFLSIFFLCVAVVIGIGLSSIRADTDALFQNEAQTHHAQNIAIEAAFHDPEVIEAKKSRDFERMNMLVDDKVAEYMQQIAEKRASGMGWGNIAKAFDVHPGVLGLGHFKMDKKYDTAFIRNRDKSPNKGFSLGHSKAQSNGRGAGHGGGKGGSHGGGRK